MNTPPSTDQPTRCPLCASTFSVTHTCASTQPPNESVTAEMVAGLARRRSLVAPTPTSSLEEAREDLVSAVDVWGADSPRVQECINNLISIVRTDVIREVEAELDRCAMKQPYGASRLAVLAAKGAVLRALSQGGEGKSDG